MEFSRLWSGHRTGIRAQPSWGQDKVHIAITRNPMSTLVGYIQISRAVVAHAIRTLDGHDGWRFIVAASALFHGVSRLSSVRDGVFIEVSML